MYPYYYSTNTTQFGNNEVTNGSIANNYCQKSSTTPDAQQVFDEIPEPNVQSQSTQKVLDELPIPTFILEMAQAAKTSELDPIRGDYEPKSDTGVLTPNRQSRKSDSATAKFEGFDLRIDSVSTLEKIWQKHGNIVENNIMRNRDIIAMSMESLATMVRILDDTSAMSLSNREVDYLVSTLSDLRHNRFKVDWLIQSVENAEKIHKSKPLMESFNNLSQLCSLAKDRRTILLEELAKFDVEESKWKEEMAKIMGKLSLRTHRIGAHLSLSACCLVVNDQLLCCST